MIWVMMFVPKSRREDPTNWVLRMVPVTTLKIPSYHLAGLQDGGAVLESMPGLAVEGALLDSGGTPPTRRHDVAEGREGAF